MLIITNGHAQVQRDKLAACRANEFFSNPHIIVGGEEVSAGNEEKPAAGIFFKACKVAGCQPNQAIHVGDNLETDVQVRNSYDFCFHI